MPAGTEHQQLSYPFEDGDVIVLGPEIFAAKDGSVLCWKGENYERQERMREVAYVSAGAGAGAVMKEAPDVVMPVAEITEAVESILDGSR